MANQQSPHWVDQVTDGIVAWQNQNHIEKLHVDDMKTPSGRIHTGSLRGILLHDLVAKSLESRGLSATSTYVFNDMDPMDGLPAYLDPAVYQEHMGKPLYQIPVPKLEDSGLPVDLLTPADREALLQAKNFAELYALDFVQTSRRLGCSQTIVWSHDLYESGAMDPIIREALDSIDQLRKIYREVADYNLPEKWYPFQVICPQCGKVGTTLVTDWDGNEVTYECQPMKVDWAAGCGHTDNVSPFGGTGKLLWKVDWPAHWKAMGVTVEGAGKDHTSAGGSRDMANAQCREVFHIPEPYDVPYEWILVRGTKMSSSKGVGTSAREFTQLFPPEIGRFLFAARNYNQVIDFDPTSMAIPDLFDEYDQAARIHWQQEAGDARQGRAFELSQIGDLPEPHFLPRFRDVALWMQYPEINLEEKCAEAKGSSLTEREQQELRARVEYAKRWVAQYAPSEFQFTPNQEIPTAVEKLTTEQRQFLGQVAGLLESKSDWQPDDLQQAIYEHAKETLGAKPGFQAIYLSLLGKTAGPRAAWLLLDQDRDFILNRFTRVSQG